MVTRPAQVSTAQYLATPPDGRRTELYYGTVVESERPTNDHQNVVHLLGEVLRRWIRKYSLGKISFQTDMVLDEERGLVHTPDLSFTTNANAPRRKQGRLYGPADLCVEIMTPNDRPVYAGGRKFSDYRRYGVRWFWSVWLSPNGPQLVELELVEDDYVERAEITGDAWFSSALFPGLIFRLPQLVEGDLKAAIKGQAKRLM